MTEKNPHPITLPTETRIMSCPISEHEKAELHEKLLIEAREVRRLEDHKKHLISSTNQLIKDHKKNQQDAAEALAQGFEMRPVSVVKKIEFTFNRVQFIRQDTGDVIEDRALTGDERIPLLLQTPTTVRFVSYEPALGPVDFSPYLNGMPVQTSHRQEITRDMAIDAGDRSLEGQLYSDDEWEQNAPPLDWLIVGGESGPNARPFDVAWARSAIAQCKAAGVPVFMKQVGTKPIWTNPAATSEYDEPWGSLTLKDHKGGDPAEWPKDLRIRDFPKT